LEGWALLAVMGMRFLEGTLCVYDLEGLGNPSFVHSALEQAGGKHGRQGGALRHRRVFAVRHGHDRFVEGRREPMHESFTPLSGGLLMAMKSCSAALALIFSVCCCSAIVTVFFGGLMVGRTPKYIGLMRSR
jgi:K+-transporting ATPase A subunit